MRALLFRRACLEIPGNFWARLLTEQRIRGIDLNPPNDAGWIASNTMERRHVFRHHTPCAHCHASTYCDTGKHNNIATKPAVLANGYGLTQLWTIDPIPEERVEWMCGRVETTVWPDEGAGSYCDKTGVKECTIEVNVYTRSNSARRYHTMLGSSVSVLLYT
jgi:hypothetical protein